MISKAFIRSCSLAVNLWPFDLNI